MKIRNGFVSNSSSSSFIVIWDKQPESVEEVKNILFGEQEKLAHYGDPVDTMILASTIFEDTKEATIDEIKNENGNLFYYDSYGYGRTGRPSWTSEGYKANKELMNKYEIEYNEDNKQRDFYKSILDDYSSEEKKSFERQAKLERVLKLDMSKREKDFHEATKEYKKYNDCLWCRSETWGKLVQESTNTLLEDYKGKFISIYEYSDNDGNLGSTLEHGGVFENLKNFKISKH